MKIVIVGFNQKQKRSLLYRQVEPKKIMAGYDYMPVAEVFVEALKRGATIISVRVLKGK